MEKYQYNTKVSNRACNKCNNYNCNACNESCLPINSYTVEYFSHKFSNLEENYPLKKCKCNQFGTNPRYYSAPYIPCNCNNKCF